MAQKPDAQGDAQRPEQPERPEGAEQVWPVWHAVFDLLAPRLKSTHGFPENVLRNTRNNQVEGIPIVILDVHNKFEVVFSTRGMQACTSWKREAIAGKQGIEFLRLKPEAMHDTLNRKFWAEIDAMKTKLAHLGVAATAPKPITELIVSTSGNGFPFWNLMDVVPLDRSADGTVTRCRYLAFVLLCLEAPVPRAIFHEGAIDVALATALVETARADLSHARRHPVGPWTPNPPTAEEAQAPPEATFLQVAETVRRELVHIHEDAQEGDHYVPKLGWAVVEAFQAASTLGRVASKVQEEIIAAWHASDEDLACIVADPSGVDCPIVFASEGFEELTGYKRGWALGRNCRFMQPNSQRTNMAVNRNEFRRLRDFCKSKDAKGTGNFMLSLLLNERADGRHFWNILYMQHIHSSTEVAGTGKSYIFGVLTGAAVQKDALDMLVLQELGGPGSGDKALQLLRDRLRKREERFVEPTKQKLLDLMAEVSLAWVREAGRSIANFWERGLFVPRVGVGAALEFSGLFPHLVDTYTALLQEQLCLTEEALNGLRGNKDMKAICVVSDPLGMDCPLVFLSRAFQETTGYDAAFGLGRNCRFLQPSTSGMNEAVNGEELAAIRYFSGLRGPAAVAAPPHVALLLNQKRTGERFWNLAHLNHVLVNNRHYILATYMQLTGVPMLALIKDACSSEAVLHHDEAQLLDFNQNLGGFCYGLRQELRARVTAARERSPSSTDDDGKTPVTNRVAEMVAHAVQALKGYMESCQNTMPPESPNTLSNSLAERFDASSWTKSLEELTHTSPLYGLFLRETTGAQSGGVRLLSGSPRCAASLADPAVEDCPLVYVSAEFEVLTGHSRQMTIGKNCKFLQPKDVNMNNLLNRGELERVREFCSKQHQEGSRLATLLVNVERDGYPFWNFLVLEHVVAEGRKYILGVQTRVGFEVARLAELLAMDSDGILELDRLRRGLKQKETILLERGPTVLMEDAIAAWLTSYPRYFELPVFEAGGPSSKRPSVSVELNAKSDLPRIFPDAIEEGVRHFHLSFEGDLQAGLDDNRVTGLTGQLFALRLAELMMSGEKRRFDILRAGIKFTVVTPPSFVNAFAELQKVLKQCRYEIDCWMLDCRGAGVQQVRDAWKAMSKAVRSGEAASLGLWAVSRQARDAIASMPGAERISVASLEMTPGQELEPMKYQLLQDLRSQLVEIEAYGILGPKLCLLGSRSIQQQASGLNMDPAMLLMKWAEAQDYISVVPQLRMGTSIVKEDDVPFRASNGAGLSSSMAETSAAQDAQPVSVHRNFVREYQNALSAQECASCLEIALGIDNTVPSYRRDRPSLSRSNSPQSTKGAVTNGPPRTPRQLSAASSRQPALSPLPARSTRSEETGPERSERRRHSECVPSLQERMKPLALPSLKCKVGAVGPGGRTSAKTTDDLANMRAQGSSASAKQEVANLASSASSAGDASPQPPLKPTPPVEGPRPQSGKRFVRQHHGTAGSPANPEAQAPAPSDDGTAAASSPQPEGEAAQEVRLETPPGEGEQSVSKAAVRLWERGWPVKEIAELFDLDAETLAQQLSKQ